MFNTTHPPQTAILPPDDRRSESRFEAEGEVEISFTQPVFGAVRARMLDQSGRGFRACHGYPGLRSGQVIEFKNGDLFGIARVIWNRINQENVETGFLLL